jgi:hypothetical protein
MSTTLRKHRRVVTVPKIKQAKREEATDDVGEGVDAVEPSAAEDKGGEGEGVERCFEEEKAFTVTTTQKGKGSVSPSAIARAEREEGVDV